MSRTILQDIIEDFAADKFKQFFRRKNRDFAPRSEALTVYDDEDFVEGEKLGELHFENGEEMIFCTFQVKQALSERSGKRKQYEKAKKILKEKQADAGIFVFYDEKGNFRFSLVYANYLGKNRDWSSFKRFTYFVSEDQTNKTFLQRIGDGDFSSFSKIKDAFSVEKVTKEFYESIANWYFWAVEHCRFPKGVETEENGRNIAVIRLITRMIFVWFMRERGLMPKHLFEKEGIDKILTNLSVEDSTYYTAILQNLFFATLSTKKEERKFRSEVRGHKGYNPDFGNQYVYRYHNLFIKPDEIKSYFGEIPFLNGGLFECLDDGRNNYYIDGFTARKQFQPIVPNFLFFSQERKADLNEAYGTKKKIYKVRGLLDILSSFNFTIDENSPDDADIALDPELLGRVFENLLASFNPETSTTARKATGSYYTPREIVDYMVTESLKAYFKTHLENIDEIDEKLEKLFSNENQENPFDQTLSKKLVELIESVKIVDPAVGSGAFPMGALNKLVFILNKIDQGNELWKQAQLKAADAIPDPSARRMAKEKIEEFFEGKNADYGRKLYLIQRCIYGVDIQQIAVEIAKLRFFISLLVDEKIDKKKENWGVEPLPNLDFKIMQGNSLIELLSPSLLAKNADSERSQLIDELKARKDEFLSLSDPTGKKKCKERILELVRSIVNYDQDKKKEQLEQKLSFFNDRQKLFEMSGDNLSLDDASTKEGKISAELKQLEKIQSISPKDHFEWHLHFNEVFEKGGFDIVIANPPYLKERDNKNVFEPVNNSSFGKKYHQGKMDFWYYFLHKAIDIVINEGAISYITSRYWLNSSGAKKLIQRVATELSFVGFVDIGKLKVFDVVAGQHMVAVYKKTKTIDTFIYKKLENDLSDLNCSHDTKNLKIKNLLNSKIFSQNNEIIINNHYSNISKTVPLGSICDTSIGVQESPDKVSKKQIQKYPQEGVNAGDGVFVLDKFELAKISPNNKEKTIIKRYLDPNDVFRYGVHWNSKYLLYSDKEIKDQIKNDIDFTNIKKHLDKYKNFITSSNKPYGLHRTRDLIYFVNPKIIFKGMFAKNEFTYDEDKYFLGFSFSSIIQKNKTYDLKYILAILNSTFALDWFYKKGKKRGAGVDIGVEKLRLFPMKIADKKDQHPFVTLVDKILAITKDDDYLQNPDKQAKVKEYEKQIDQLVYELYDLTPQEIQIIESST